MQQLLIMTGAVFGTCLVTFLGFLWVDRREEKLQQREAEALKALNRERRRASRLTQLVWEKRCDESNDFLRWEEQFEDAA